MSYDFTKVESNSLNKSKNKAEKEFYFLYSSALSIFKKTNGQDIKVYAYLLLNYLPGTIIGVNKRLKESIVYSLGTGSVGSINNSLRELCKSKLLIHDARGSYIINPVHAWKGSTHDRNDYFKNNEIEF